MDDTTAEVVRRLEGMGLRVYALTDSPNGMWINVLIPSVEFVASGNKRPQN